MRISPNAVFHFTKMKDSLIGILHNNFKIKYCLESINIGDKYRFVYGVPMVSFCDITLSSIKEHTSKYGNYGIGLSKEWAIKNGLNPVVYLEANSSITKSIDEIFTELFINNKKKALSNFDKNVLNVFRYIKNYEGTLEYNKKTIENYRYSDEREWRYCPEIDKCKEILLEIEMYDSDEKKKRWNQTLDNLKLFFEPNDIKYIIIKNDDEISEFLRELRDSKGKKYFHDDVERLMTRIITSEQIQDDL